jgi:hypothetical protein
MKLLIAAHSPRPEHAARTGWGIMSSLFLYPFRWEGDKCHTKSR